MNVVNHEFTVICGCGSTNQGSTVRPAPRHTYWPTRNMPKQDQLPCPFPRERT